MTRPPALVKAQAAYEAKRNARKVLLRLSEEEAAFVDGPLQSRMGKWDATREQIIRMLIRDVMDEVAEAKPHPARKPRSK